MTGLAELFETHGLDPANAEPLRALASLDGGMETLGPARELLSSMDGVSLEALDELESTLTALAALGACTPGHGGGPDGRSWPRLLHRHGV